MRHRVIGFGVGFLIFLVTLVAGMIVHSRFTPGRVWLSTTSPNQKYTVELTGDKGRGGILFFSTVKYNILVDGKLLTKDRVVTQILSTVIPPTAVGGTFRSFLQTSPNLM